MTKSCVAIWVGKIKGDYERYSKAVCDEMSQASSKLSESIWCKHLYICAHYGFSMYVPIHLQIFCHTHICWQPLIIFLVREVIMYSLNNTAVVKV